MPLTPEQKREKVLAAGLDPSQYTYVEPQLESSVNPEEDFPVEAKPVETPSVPQMGMGEAFGRSALRSLVPSASALGGMRAGFALPLPHPLLKGAAGLMGGLAGSYLGGLGQEKALQAVQGEEAYNQGLAKQAQAREQHSVASTFGELGPNFFALGPGGIGTGLKGFSKLLQPSTISAAEKLGMGQLGIGTGLAGGMELGRQYLQGEQLDPVKTAITAIVGGALQNNPTKLGSKILGPNFPGANAHLNRPIEPTKGRTYEDIGPEVSETKPLEATRNQEPGLPAEEEPLDKNTIRTEVFETENPGVSKTRTEVTGDYETIEKFKKLQREREKAKGKPVIDVEEVKNVDSETGEEINPDPTEKFYQENEDNPDRWNPEQLIPGTNFALKVQRWANSLQGQQSYEPTQLLNTLKNKFPGDMELLSDRGFDEFIKTLPKGTKISGTNLDSWIRNNGPMVENKSLYVNKAAGPKETAFNDYTHRWYDRLNQNQQQTLDEVWRTTQDMPDEFAAHLKAAGWNPEQIENASNYLRLSNDMRGETSQHHNDRVESATARYTMVNPKPLKDMPGAVDLLVRIPTHSDLIPYEEQSAQQRGAKNRNERLGIKYQSSHYPTEGKNLLAHVRGNMETLPNGKKVFHVFELQSDWAQARRSFETSERPETGPYYRAEIQSDPLLKNYERLALKTAIDHAIKEGADYIALSDAETAMITEGHDRNQENGRYGPIPQEQGMRLHYDQTLPRILTELTGDSGANKVSFGEHQNTKLQGSGYPDEPLRKDLIFKNKDNTPKTDITARLYNLDQAKQSIREKGGIALTGKKLYSEQPPESTSQRLTPEQYESNIPLARKRGVNLERVPEIISERTGRPVRGEAIPSQRKALITDIATSDTPAHEVGHNYLRDLNESRRPTDVEHFTKGVNDPKIIEEARRQSEFYKREVTPEEVLNDLTAKRSLEIGEKPVRSYLEDAGNYLKEKTGLGEVDPVKTLGRRLRDDRPYAESPELHKDLNEYKEKLYAEVSGSSGRASGSGNSTERKYSQGFGPFTSLTERIRAKGPGGEIAAKAIEGAEREGSRLNGKFTEPAKFAANQIKDKEGAARYIWESRYGKPKVILNTADKAIVDGELNNIYRLVHKEQNEFGPLVDGKRQAISNPNLRGPNGIKQEVLRTLIDKPQNDVHRQTLIKDFIDHQIKFDEDIQKIKSPEAKQVAAKEKFNTILSGFSPATKGSTASFNALRKAEGIGIPWSWMEKDPVKLFSRYGNRVSRDLAYYRNIESKPEVAALFGLKKMPGVEPLTGNEITTANKRLVGEHTYNETLFNSIEHFVRGLILGPVTGVKNTTTTLAQILPYVPIKDLPKIISAFKYIRKGFQDSMDLGVNRRSITGLEVGGEGSNPASLTRLGENLKGLGDIARKYTGANAIEQWTRAHNMALGEILTESYWGRAANGDIDAVRFLKKFAPEEANFKKPLTEDVLKETAARFVERVQGTYGSRGLPAFLLEPSSPAYWFMSLAKWSVEKSNVIKQDVINPALKGEDYGPLLRYTLGGLVTGEVVRQIGEVLMGGKKTSTPDIKELQEKGKASDWAYKFFELASLAGLGGLYGDLAKGAGDLTKGYNTRGYNIPSVEIAKDLAGEVSAAAQAIQEGQSPLQVIHDLALNIITDNIQALRLARNFANPEEVDRLNKFRDKRVYDKLEGKNIPPVSQRMDRYGGLAEREFKRAKTTEEAGKIYKEKLQPKLQGLSREEKQKELSSLKRNGYQTVPSGGKDAQDYLSYISKTQGSEAAKALKEDKRRQDLVNRQKQRFLR